MKGKMIGEFLVHKKTKDLTGLTFGLLSILSIYDRNEKRDCFNWSCTCSCGNARIANSKDLLAGSTKSCGCLEVANRLLLQAKFSDKYKTHGATKTKEYNTWKGAKKRCTNPESQDYEVYSKIGMSESFIESYEAFISDIGPIPESLKGTKVSIDRIDNTKGYVEGNVRWATNSQQARNKGMYSNNKSGVTGVYSTQLKSGDTVWVATHYEVTGESKSKRFHASKLGEELAFFAACEYRDLMIQRMNLMGHGYTENHGK